MCHRYTPFYHGLYVLTMADATYEDYEDVVQEVNRGTRNSCAYGKRDTCTALAQTRSLEAGSEVAFAGVGFSVHW